MNVIYTCFPGGKHKVLTMSYDDGKVEDRKLVSIFNQYGIKGTFNLNSGIVGDEKRIPTTEYKELYKGHEVACHTATHPTIERCPMTEVVKQVMEDREKLEAIMDYPVRGLAYPNGSYSEDIMRLLPDLGIKYGRIVGNTDNFAMPSNFMEWKATCHHNHNLMENAKNFAGLFKTQYLYMMYVWGHSYEFGLTDNWNVMEEFCQFIGEREDIWYATNIDIVDYMEEAKRLRFTAKGDYVFNPSASDIWLEVNKEIYCIKGGEEQRLTK